MYSNLNKENQKLTEENKDLYFITTELNVSNKHLTTLPHDITLYKNLQTLDLTGNKFDNVHFIIIYIVR